MSQPTSNRGERHLGCTLPSCPAFPAYVSLTQPWSHALHAAQVRTLVGRLHGGWRGDQGGRRVSVVTGRGGGPGGGVGRAVLENCWAVLGTGRGLSRPLEVTTPRTAKISRNTPRCPSVVLWTPCSNRPSRAGSGTTGKQPANLAVEGAEESLSILSDFTPTVRRCRCRCAGVGYVHRVARRARARQLPTSICRRRDHQATCAGGCGELRRAHRVPCATEATVRCAWLQRA
jgi:hypothetical protein